MLVFVNRPIYEQSVIQSTSSFAHPPNRVAYIVGTANYENSKCTEIAPPLQTQRTMPDEFLEFSGETQALWWQMVDIRSFQY
jgi:hypothetical protein